MSVSELPKLTTTRWSYAAAAMAAYFNFLVEPLTAKPAELLKGPRLSVQWLLRDAIEGARDPVARCKHLHCFKREYFVIAAQALREQVPNAVDQPERVIEILERFQALFSSLPFEGALPPEMVQTARDCAQFLRCVVLDGDASAYAEHMDGSLPVVSAH